MQNFGKYSMDDCIYIVLLNGLANVARYDPIENIEKFKSTIYKSLSLSCLP